MHNPDRREFLLGSMATMAATRLAAQSSQELRTAFIGVGNRGRSLLGQVIEQPNVKVTHICDIDPQARDQALTMAKRDNPQTVTEWRKVMDLKDVDAVVVATPCNLHAEMAAACLEAGKYVYCEKPMAITPEQVSNVLRAAKRSKAFLQIGQQLRYFPSMRTVIKQILEDRIIGDTYVIKAQRHSSPSRPDPSGKRTRATWYDSAAISGDLIVENTVHNLDACNWIANSRPVSAYGHGKKYFPKAIPAGTIMMDGFSVEYIYENDMHLDFSQLHFHPRTLKVLPNGMWYTIFGQKGAVYLTHETGFLHDLYGESEPKELVSPELKDKKENAMAEFYACIREKRAPFADVKVGAVAALTGIMGREAIYKRRMVTWKELGVEV